MTGFCCLLQLKEGLLLLLMLSLHLTVLLLEHFSVVLERSEWAGEDMIIQKQEQKNSLFRLYIVDLGTIMGFSDKPNRTSKAQS